MAGPAAAAPACLRARRAPGAPSPPCVRGGGEAARASAPGVSRSSARGCTRHPTSRADGSNAAAPAPGTALLDCVAHACGHGAEELGNTLRENVIGRTWHAWSAAATEPQHASRRAHHTPWPDARDRERGDARRPAALGVCAGSVPAEHPGVRATPHSPARAHKPSGSIIKHKNGARCVNMPEGAPCSPTARNRLLPLLRGRHALCDPKGCVFGGCEATVAQGRASEPQAGCPADERCPRRAALPAYHTITRATARRSVSDASSQPGGERIRPQRGVSSADGSICAKHRDVGRPRAPRPVQRSVLRCRAAYPCLRARALAT